MRKDVDPGRVLRGIAVLFLAFDATVKLLELPVAVDGTVKLGYPQSTTVSIGLIQVALS